MKFIYTAFLVLLCFRSFAQTNNSSGRVEGWRDAKWGMSPDQVIAAFKGEAVKIDGKKWKEGVGLVEIEKINIGDNPFSVTFVFAGESPKLREIALQPTKDVKFPETLFVPIAEKLTEKYGKPDFSNDEHKVGEILTTRIRKRIWKRGPTRIELKYLDIATQLLSVTYTEVPEEGEKNL